MSEPFVSTAKTGNYRLDDADFLAYAELSADTREVEQPNPVPAGI
jgi:hypothetical protein